MQIQLLCERSSLPLPFSDPCCSACAAYHRPELAGKAALANGQPNSARTGGGGGGEIGVLLLFLPPIDCGYQASLRMSPAGRGLRDMTTAAAACTFASCAEFLPPSGAALLLLCNASGSQIAVSIRTTRTACECGLLAYMPMNEAHHAHPTARAVALLSAACCSICRTCRGPCSITSGLQVLRPSAVVDDRRRREQQRIRPKAAWRRRRYGVDGPCRAEAALLYCCHYCCYPHRDDARSSSHACGSEPAPRRYPRRRDRRR